MLLKAVFRSQKLQRQANSKDQTVTCCRGCIFYLGIFWDYQEKGIFLK